MDSKELTKAMIAALPDTLEELTARLRQVVAQEPDPLVTRIERMRGAIADARTRIVQHMPDGPERGAIIAFLDQAAYGRDHPARCFNTFPGATMCEVCGGDLEGLRKAVSLLRDPVASQPSNAPPGILNKPAGMA